MNDVVNIKLKDGKTIRRKMRWDKRVGTYVKYLGYWVIVEYCNGEYVEFIRV